MDKKMEKKIVNTALRNNGYYFDLDNSCLIVTKKFKNLIEISNHNCLLFVVYKIHCVLCNHKFFICCKGNDFNF